MLAIAAVASTALTIFAGGLVTGFDAGFAVTGWPDTFGANMFFYPYSKMTGGIYYEHAHRLLGATTGVTAVALAAHMLWLDRRRLMRWAVVAAVILVCLQGLLGALWVIDKTLVYYLVHGTLAQLLLGCFVAITAGEMRTWREADLSAATPTAAADRRLAVGLVAALIVQLILGVVVRRTGQLVILHIANASLVVMAAVAVGMRCVAGPGAAHAALKRTGMMILGVTVVQVILGVVSLAFRETEGTKTVVVGSSKVGSASDAVWTTLHQSVGALLLAIAVLAMVLVYRLLRPEALTQTPVAAAGTELDVA
ncbi:MAG: hypothetical protein CMJ49_01940 [Planctomycetaceae bacterium]|nr:hypothetical protein [Planctomycetaceae bacterium]